MISGKKCSKTIKECKQIIFEITGLIEYEKHIERLLRNGKEKKALKIARKKLGSMKRGKKKRDLINEITRKI